MKKLIITLIIIIVVLLLVIILFKVNNKNNNSFDFYETNEYKKIINNKDNIKQVKEVINTYEYKEEVITNEDGLNILKKLNNLTKTDIRVTDSDKYYSFEFNDGEVINIYFEGEFFRYNNQNYIIK